MRKRKTENATGLPRYVRPEVLEEGDSITVTFADRDGVRQTRTGVIGWIDRRAGTKVYTDQGGILFTSEHDIAHVTLLARSVEPSIPLFEMGQA